MREWFFDSDFSFLSGVTVHTPSPLFNTDSMKKICFLLVPVAASLLLSGCFSLMKADHMVYAGSIGKKFDAVVIDSISRIDTSSSGVDVTQ